MTSCNRRACRLPGARWWHQAMHAYYCDECAGLIAPNIPAGRGYFRLGGPEGPPIEDFFPTPPDQLPNERSEWEWQYRQAARRAPQEEYNAPEIRYHVPVVVDGEVAVLSADPKLYAALQDASRRLSNKQMRKKPMNSMPNTFGAPYGRSFAALPLAAAIAASYTGEEYHRSPHAKGHMSPAQAKVRAQKKSRRALEKAGRKAARRG